MPNFIKNEFVSLIVAMILALILGIAIGATYKEFFNITWKTEVGLEALINVVAGIAIGIFLQHAYQKQNENLRVEKGIVIDECKVSIKQLRDIRNNFRTCVESNLPAKDFDYSFVNSFRLLSNEISSIKDFMEALDYPDEVIICDEILSSIIDYKTIITGGPEFPTDSYSPEEFKSGERKFDQINKSLHSFLVKINRF
ncbi:MAG: hypothetical protein R2747_13535 [Pyrinomonadaceae bacterium]